MKKLYFSLFLLFFLGTIVTVVFFFLKDKPVGYFSVPHESYKSHRLLMSLGEKIRNKGIDVEVAVSKKLDGRIYVEQIPQKLNKNEEKIVISPEYWFNQSMEVDSLLSDKFETKEDF